MKNIVKFEDFILLEKSYYSIGYDDVFTPDYRKRIKKEDFYGDRYEVYMNRNDIEDSNDVNDSDVEEYVNDELDNNYEEFRSSMNYLIEDGYITLWRAMTVNDDWLSKIEKGNIRIGEYWSWDERSAEAHWSEGHDNAVVMRAKVKEQYVDWTVTFEMNIHPSFTEEKEIRLFKNMPIQIEQIVMNDEEIDSSIFEDKIYKA